MNAAIEHAWAVHFQRAARKARGRLLDARADRKRAEGELAEARTLLERADEQRARIQSERDRAQAEVLALRQISDSWHRIGGIVDQFEDGHLPPFDAIKAVGEQVRSR